MNWPYLTDTQLPWNLSSNHNIIISPSDKGRGVVIMDSTVYNQNLMDLLGDKNIYEQISLQIVSNNINDFNKSYRKLILTFP